MVDEDLEMAKREKVLVDAGYIDAQQQPYSPKTESYHYLPFCCL